MNLLITWLILGAVIGMFISTISSSQVKQKIFSLSLLGAAGGLLGGSISYLLFRTQFQAPQSFSQLNLVSSLVAIVIALVLLSTTEITQGNLNLKEFNLKNLTHLFRTFLPTRTLRWWRR